MQEVAIYRVLYGFWKRQRNYAHSSGGQRSYDQPKSATKSASEVADARMCTREREREKVNIKICQN